MLKSDNATLVGKHCFEVAGLGTAPFKIVGFAESKFQAAPGAPILPGTSCDYCSTGIMYVCYIQGAGAGDKAFKVGCDCVQKTHDEGLIKAYKRSPEYRAHQKALRDAKDERNKQELARMLSDETIRTQLAAVTFTSHYSDGTARADNKLAQAERSLPWCGAKGRAEWRSIFRKILGA